MLNTMSVFTTEGVFRWSTQGDASDPKNQLDEGFVVVDGTYNSTYRLAADASSAELKVLMEPVFDALTIGVGGQINILGLPENTTLTVLEHSEVSTTGSFTFQTDLARTYQLVFSHPLYLDTYTEVTVT